MRLTCETSLICANDKTCIVFDDVTHPCLHLLDDCGSLKEESGKSASEYAGKNTVKVIYLQSRLFVSFILLFLHSHFSLASWKTVGVVVGAWRLKEALQNKFA